MRALILVAIIAAATAFSGYRNNFPNGNANVANFPPGHQNPAGAGPLDTFGQDYQNEPDWLAGLCQQDSDGDNQINGLELGDPCCHWTTGKPPQHTDLVSDPSDAGETTNAQQCVAGTNGAFNTPAVANVGCDTLTITWGFSDLTQTCHCGFQVTVAQPANAVIDGFVNGQLNAPQDYAKQLVLTALQPATDYVFDIVSLDIAGNDNGVAALQIAGTTAAPSPPSAPTVECATVGADTIELTLTVTDNGCLPIDKFDVTQDGAAVYSGAVPQARVSGLSPGVDYTFAASATNAQGQSPEGTVTCKLGDNGGNDNLIGAGVMAVVSMVITGVLTFLAFV